MSRNPSKLIPTSFSGVPSLAWLDALRMAAVSELDESAGAIVVAVEPGVSPAGVDVDPDALERAGFEGKTGQTLLLPQQSGPQVVLVGSGPTAELDPTALRALAASAARATTRYPHVGLHLPAFTGVDA